MVRVVSFSFRCLASSGAAVGNRWVVRVRIISRLSNAACHGRMLGFFGVARCAEFLHPRRRRYVTSCAGLLVDVFTVGRLFFGRSRVVERWFAAKTDFLLGYIRIFNSDRGALYFFRVGKKRG